MGRTFHRLTVSIYFTAACLVIAGIGFGTYWSTHRLVRSFNSVTESHKAVEKLQSIQELLQAAESSAYNYVITGREDRLEAYRTANQKIPQTLRDIQSLIKNNSRQTNALKQFRQVYSVHQDYLAKIIVERREHGVEAASQWVSAEDDRSIRDVLHILLADIQKEQSKVVRRRAASSSEHSLETKLSMVAAAGAVLILIAGIFGWLRRERGERFVAESTNQQLETFLRSIIERIPYMVTVKDANTLRLTLVNKAATEWFGRTETELLGSNDYDFRPRAAAKKAMQQDRDVLCEGRGIDIPEELVVFEGKGECILHTQKLAIPDADGDPAFILTISEDITMRKQAEEELEVSRDTAIQSERLKSEFIRNMSHEFRTPLSIVVGITSILLDSELTAEQRSFARKIESAANSLAKLTKSIMDFSKIESGAFMVEMQEMNLRQTIDSVLEMVKEQAKAKGISLVSLVPAQVPQTLIGDPIRLRQVLTELIGNALKFSEKGEIIVRAEDLEQDDQTIHLTLKVSDTGPGIPEDVQKHLFQPFRQGDGSPTRRFGGTGLGLAISKKIVELLGGKIGFSSAVNEGSTFWCTLPFKKLSVSGHLGKVTSSTWRQARLLVVDENAITRQLLCNQLKAWSLMSEGASDGERAMRLLHSEKHAGRPFQIVLFNIHMADMEGVAFAKRVRENPAFAGIQLLVFSQDPIDASTAHSLGFTGCLPLGCKPEELYDTLSGLIESGSFHSRSAA